MPQVPRRCLNSKAEPARLAVISLLSHLRWAYRRFILRPEKEWTWRDVEGREVPEVLVEVIELITLFKNASSSGRSQILHAARTVSCKK